MTIKQKEYLRKTCLQIRNSLSKTTQSSASKNICDKIKTLDIYKKPVNIGLYIATNREIDLSFLWNENITNIHNYFFPKIHAKRKMSFLPATNKTTFLKNQFGILEPDIDNLKAINPNLLDIIFIPLVAFDEQGARLGMGCGYYDRALENNESSQLIGVAYEFQKQQTIPSDSWDIKLDMIITEESIYYP
jgi:5-formyltetrahydrofolate cyclo-ligase